MRKFFLIVFILISMVAWSGSFAAIRTNVTNGYIITPNSSIANPKDAGIRSHTNYKIYVPYQKTLAALPGGETPASIACVYGLTKMVPGCPINGTTALPNGGWGTIALVDAYDNPNAETDLNTFSTQFGLPPCTTGNGCFSQVYASGHQPAFDPDWAVEEALDIEWAHAMAPNARIILVEADTNSNTDLFGAEDVASQLVQAGGGGDVSNSWGGSEYAGEATLDSHFQTPTVVYFASSGDSGAPASYPASSPFLVSAGGTSLIRSQGNFKEEDAWSYDATRHWGGSGGPSIYESRPPYQNGIQKIVGNSRGTPDIAFDANPVTGVDIYVTSHGGWLIVGGTSVSSPSLAGIVNAANLRLTSANQELTYIYGQSLKNYHSFWHDVLVGNNGFPCLAGYDFATGLGSPAGYGGK